MNITGKLIKILPETTGESARGSWIRGGFVVETLDEYPRQIAFQCFGEEKCTKLNGIAIGTEIQVTFSLQSREYNDKWYTNVDASAIIPIPQYDKNNISLPKSGTDGTQKQKTEAYSSIPQAPNVQSDEDLPF